MDRAHARHADGLRQPASITVLRERKTKEDAYSGWRRQCVSLDETTNDSRQQWLRHLQTTSNACTDQSPQRVHVCVLEPATPPFLPPERVKTPDGIPSWRGQRVPQVLHRYANSEATGTVPRFRRLLRRSSRVFSHIFGVPDQAPQQRQRLWRPPDSGHATTRYESLNSHPFVRTAMIGVPSDAPAQEDSGGQRSQRKQRHLGVASVRSAGEQTRASYPPGTSRTPSQRALRSASGNAYPVSPHRAECCARAAQIARSVSLPKRHIPRNMNDQDDRDTRQDPCASVRTAELIQQFPAPPTFIDRVQREWWASQPQLSSSNAAQQRHDQRMVLVSREGCLTSFTELEGRNSFVSGNHLLWLAQYGIEDDTSGLFSRLCTLTNAQCSGVAEIAHSNSAGFLCQQRPSISDKKRALIALSGIVLPLSLSNRTNTNGRNDDSTRTTLGTRVICQNRSRHYDNNDRSPPARTSRCTRHVDLSSNVSPRLEEPSGQPNENDFSMVPITITQASGDICRHRIVNDSWNRYDLDGTSPTVEFSTPATLCTRQDRHSFASFRQRFRLRNSGTWRSRMGKQKCWRCELESRRTAAREALYERHVNVRGWMIRLKEKLRYTCLCRYTAYDDDSDDGPTRSRVVEERVRLGRMGGNLN